MQLKQTILGLLSSEALKEVCGQLDVDRDCRKNTKKVKIAIDGKTIAIYEADCVMVTVGTFGGVMSEP